MNGAARGRSAHNAAAHGRRLLPRYLGLLLATLVVGSALSLAISMLAARDLARQPAMPGSGMIGGGGYTEDFLDLLWRRTTPESWHAWGDGSRLNTPTTGPESGNDVGILVGDTWKAVVVAGRGCYDVVWIDRFVPAPHDEGAQRSEYAENALPAWEREERVGAGQVLVTTAPAWIPPELSRACDGFLPGRSAATGAVFRAVEVPEDAWMPARHEGEPGERLSLRAEHVVGTRRIDEVRLFGWPFRAFTVQGAVKEQGVYEIVPGYGLEEVSRTRLWWSDGLAVRPGDGFKIGYALSEEIDGLPAKGLPWRPRWPALLANAAILGLPAVLGAMLVARLVGRGIALLRRDRNRCRTCGYPRTGLADGAPCPECGGR